MTRDERRTARLALGRAAVLTEATAVELLPVGDAVARAWLRQHELVRQVDGLGRVVIWGEVLARIEAGEGPAAERPTRQPRLKRKALR